MGYRVPWSDLPEELLQHITKSIDTRFDLLRFRAVCRSWRSSCPLKVLKYLSPHLPLKIPASPIILPNRIPTSPTAYFRLFASAIYLVKPPEDSKNTLFKVEELSSGNLLLRKPLTEFSYKDVLAESPKTFNWFDCTEVCKFYNVRLSKNLIQSCGWLLRCLDKVVLFSNSSRPTEVAAVVMLYGRNLRFLRLGDDKWTRIPYASDGCSYDDLVNYKGQICAVNCRGRAVRVDYNSLKVTDIASPIRNAGNRRKHLVESCGDLFLVVSRSHPFQDKVKYYHEDADHTIWFDVYKLNEDTHKWDQIKSLGDRVLFVGADCSFSVSARNFSGCKGNCIFVMRGSFDSFFDDDRLMLNRLEGLGIGVFHLEDGGTFRPLESYPDYPDIFWCPPKSCSSKS